MWVRFTRNFDFNPPELNGRVTIAYQAGSVLNVRRICGEAAKAAGRAVDHEARRKDHGATDRVR